MSAPSIDAAVDLPGAIESVLDRFLCERTEFVRAIHPGAARAAEVIRAFVLGGGKRTRPTFAVTGWHGAAPAGSAVGAAVIQACAAVELVHANALIHDDIIDRSDTRRGAPAVHRQFANRHTAAGFAGDAAHYGTAMGILLGDLALAWADDMFYSAALDPAALGRAAPVWAAMRTEVLTGQLLDIEAEVAGDESVGAALLVNRYKTAAYTIERPLHLGAALAGADAELITAYREFGAKIGLAFQLRDDLLGVFGDARTTGKPSGDDLRSGKRTVLVATALQRADPAAAQQLRSALGTDLSDADVDRLRALIHATGASGEVERRIEELTEQAVETLAASSATEQARNDLRAMAYAAVRRDR
ncbi:polyprenyl synthetase family protein [Nocardia sp. NPDC055321]